MEREKRKDERFEQILLLGCDVNKEEIEEHRATDKDRCQRSDTIVVLSLDKVQRKIKMIDLMRDVWVPIPGHGMHKLNDAVVYGGAKMAIQIINEKFDLNIRKYAMITVRDMVDLIDLFGGVDVNLTILEAIYINVWMPNVKLITERDEEVPRITAEGWNHLNGMQTLAHVRNRTNGYMMARENRANDVLKSMARHARKEMTPLQCLRFALAARKYVKTNLGAPDVVKLLRFAIHIDPDTIEAYHAPEEGTYEVKNDFTWRMEVDFPKAAQQLWDFIEA